MMMHNTCKNRGGGSKTFAFQSSPWPLGYHPWDKLHIVLYFPIIMKVLSLHKRIASFVVFPENILTEDGCSGKCAPARGNKRCFLSGCHKL